MPLVPNNAEIFGPLALIVYYRALAESALLQLICLVTGLGF